MPAGTVTLPDVELVKVGTWAASTGVVTVTAEDLADMVTADGDADVDRAPVKLGHTGALSTLGDSEPALGWVANLRTADDGQTLVGDLTDVPAGIADALQAAYKRRSVEIAWGVKTPAGKEYRAVIEGLALLGVQAPAVKGLADIVELYRPKAHASALEVGSRSALALYDGEPDHPERVANALRWAREAAAALAALVGVGGLQAAFDAIDAMTEGDSRGLLSQATHDDPVTKTAPSGGSQMSTAPKITPEDAATARKILGLADDVSDADVASKLSELLPLAPKTDDDEVETTEEEEVLEPAAALSADTVKALKDAGLTVITDSAFETLQTNAQLGAAAASQLAAQRRDQVLDEAERAGKFGGGEQAAKTRSSFAALLDKDFDGAKAVIDSLPAIAPVAPLGHDGTGATHDALAASADAQLDAEIAALFDGQIATPAKEA